MIALSPITIGDNAITRDTNQTPIGVQSSAGTCTVSEIAESESGLQKYQSNSHRTRITSRYFSFELLHCVSDWPKVASGLEKYQSTFNRSQIKRYQSNSHRTRITSRYFSFQTELLHCVSDCRKWNRDWRNTNQPSIGVESRDTNQTPIELESPPGTLAFKQSFCTVSAIAESGIGIGEIPINLQSESNQEIPIKFPSNSNHLPVL